jgi:hypothetical protein
MLVKKQLDSILNLKVNRSGAHSSDAPKESAGFLRSNFYKKVIFDFYRQGELWYKTECGFSFPVPISDTGTGTFLREDKALLFMRYIRKHIEMINQSKEAIAPKTIKVTMR